MGIIDTLFRRKAAAPAQTPRAVSRSAPVRGRYDNANPGPATAAHFARATNGSADALASPSARLALRKHARYEVANNAYARGIVDTLANDMIGTGPRLQARTDDAEANATIEREFHEWMQASNLAEKLRIMRRARAESGEVFAVIADNPQIPHPITVDISLVEADRVTSNTMMPSTDEVDGITYDTFGNPLAYLVLNQHPGDGVALTGDESQVIAAEQVIHYFQATRPGQHRGVPDITPALPLFAQLRRYTTAVLGAAETCADFAGILYTDSPATGEADDLEPLDAVDLEPRTLLTMPGGWKMSQVKAEQPTTTYGEFKREILNEIARCLNMPFNVAAGNSSGYNYASGRLDHQTYHKSVRVERHQFATTVLDRVFSAWMDEAILIPGLLPVSIRSLPRLPHSWLWDGFEHVDPLKEASATAVRLSAGLTTLAAEYGKQGKDWEAEVEQRAAEIETLARFGVDVDTGMMDDDDDDLDGLED